MLVSFMFGRSGVLVSAVGDQCDVSIRELHGDGDDGTTAVMGLNFITDTVVIARMGTASTVVPQEQ